jgi:hypothetical protein
MAYTPELSRRESAIVKRVAWSMGKPMTKALPEMIHLATETLKSTRICETCLDKSFCPQCPFNQSNMAKTQDQKRNG